MCGVVVVSRGWCWSPVLLVLWRNSCHRHILDVGGGVMGLWVSAEYYLRLFSFFARMSPKPPSARSSSSRLQQQRQYHAKHHALLQVRGGDASPLATTRQVGATVVLQSTAVATAVNYSYKATTTQELSTKQRYWRIARELGLHVWPSVPKKEGAQKKQQQRTRRSSCQCCRKCSLNCQQFML